MTSLDILKVWVLFLLMGRQLVLLHLLHIVFIILHTNNVWLNKVARVILDASGAYRGILPSYPAVSPIANKSQYSAAHAISQHRTHRFTVSCKPKDLPSSTQSATKYWRFLCITIHQLAATDGAMGCTEYTGDWALYLIWCGWNTGLWDLKVLYQKHCKLYYIYIYI